MHSLDRESSIFRVLGNRWIIKEGPRESESFSVHRESA